MSHTVYGNTCSYKLFQITACHNVIMTERERYLSRIFDLLAFERLCSLCDSPLVFSFAIKKIIVSIQNRLTPGDKFDIMRYTFSIKEKNTPIYETKKAIVYIRRCTPLSRHAPKLYQITIIPSVSASLGKVATNHFRKAPS